MPKTIAPRRGDPFTDGNGIPSHRSMVWIESVTGFANGLSDQIDIIEDRLDELEPQYIEIDNADSPYTGANNDYILVDMDAGPVDVVMPTSGRLSVSRKHITGGANALTLIGTINGEVDPEILFDGSCATMAYIAEWRYV